MAIIYEKKHKLPDGTMLHLKIVPDARGLSPRFADTLGRIVIPLHLGSWRGYGGAYDMLVDLSIPDAEDPYNLIDALNTGTFGYTPQIVISRQDVLSDPFINPKLKTVLRANFTSLKGDEHLEYMKALIGGARCCNTQDVIIYPFTRHEQEGVLLLIDDPKAVDYRKCGFIFTTHDAIRWHLGLRVWHRIDYEKVKNILQRELDILSSWLNDESYSFGIEQYSLDEHGEELGRKFLCGIGGFLGDLDYCKRKALAAFRRMTFELSGEFKMFYSYWDKQARGTSHSSSSTDE